MRYRIIVLPGSGNLPYAIFVDLAEQCFLYTIKPYIPRHNLIFNLTGTDDLAISVEGLIEIVLLNEDGITVLN